MSQPLTALPLASSSNGPSRPGRNRAIDVLRGLAIVLMICNHVGASSHVTTIANLPVWLDPAGPFVLFAGLVLGMGLQGDKPLGSVWPRVRKLWLIHVVCMSLVLLVHETTGRLNAPSIASAGGYGWAALKVLTLRLQALDYMNILPLFIVFFAAAPLLITAMRRGLTWLCVACSLGLWLYAQSKPEWLRFTDPASGPEAFVLAAWQFAFVLALTLGIHARRLPDFFRRTRAWLLPVTMLVASALFVLAQLQRHAFLRFGAHIPDSLAWLVSKETWGPGRAVYTLALLGLAYLGLSWLSERGRDQVFRPLELMGRRSLYCFLVHLPLALLASGLDLPSARPVMQDVAAVSAVLTVYLLARYQVLARYIPS